MEFILSTDTSCDVFKSEIAAHHAYYVPLTYTIDGESYEDHFDKDEQYKAFYDKIRGGAMPTTSQVTIFQHEEYFRSIFAKEATGDIIHLTLSSGLSSTYASALKAAENLAIEFPSRKIYVVDTLSATCVHGMVYYQALKLRDEGLEASAAFDALQTYIKSINVWFMTVDLMHLKRGGRVSGPMAYIGTALNIKPILTINSSGGLTVATKKPGVNNGMRYMIDTFAKTVVDEPHEVFIPQADSDLCDAFIEKLRAQFPKYTFRKNWVGPVIGAHTGVGLLGISYISKVPRLDGPGMAH